MMAAAEPSLTPEQSKIPSAPATSGEHAIVSLDTSLRNCARGLRAPFRREVHERSDHHTSDLQSPNPLVFPMPPDSMPNIIGAVISPSAPAPTEPAPANTS